MQTDKERERKEEDEKMRNRWEGARWRKGRGGVQENERTTEGERERKRGWEQAQVKLSEDDGTEEGRERRGRRRGEAASGPAYANPP